MTFVVPYIPKARTASDIRSTKSFEAGSMRNFAQFFIIRFDVCGCGSSQGTSPSFGCGAKQKGRQSLRPALILFTSNVITATKKVIIITYENVTAKAA